MCEHLLSTLNRNLQLVCGFCSYQSPIDAKSMSLLHVVARLQDEAREAA